MAAKCVDTKTIEESCDSKGWRDNAQWILGLNGDERSDSQEVGGRQ